MSGMSKGPKLCWIMAAVALGCVLVFVFITLADQGHPPGGGGEYQDAAKVWDK
jgi:hypothetical protein